MLPIPQRTAYLHPANRPSPIAIALPIINSYTLDMVENPRLQQMKERMSQYQFTAVWRTGKSLCIPDALSRAPVSYPTSEDMTGCAEVTAHVRSVINPTTASQDEDAPTIDADRTLQDMSIAAQADPTYVRLRDCISSGFPTNRYDLHASLSPYWKLREALSTDGNLVLYGARILVPAALRRHTLARLHDSHRGVEATKRRVRQTVFWPGIDSDIANTVAACEPCQVLRPSQQREPLHNDDHPSRPFESVSADFFQVAGKSFLVVADRLSGWPVVVPCKGDYCLLDHTPLLPLLQRERWCVHHITSSPHYPQSNGHAEAAVKAVKHLILKTAPTGNIDCEDFDRGLLELRNTPNQSGRSPAQVLYGHPLRTCVPAHPQSFTEDWQEKAHDCDHRAAARAAQVQRNYDAHARPLPRLNVGQHVRLQDPTSHRWDTVGIVMGGARSREYEIRLPSGRVLRRNRRFLYPLPTTSHVPNSALPVVPIPDMEKSSIPSKAPRRSPRLNRPP
ncbi:uncharacterized protein K02A2.6-like [Macrobrachium nipponense]|uniref:uncharacterized protein K02A2.6-like n=1 Tax=Macrobrachium nipponense TaxID=159736 RepID=UPI0030C82E8D